MNNQPKFRSISRNRAVNSRTNGVLNQWVNFKGFIFGSVIGGAVAPNNQEAERKTAKIYLNKSRSTQDVTVINTGKQLSKEALKKLKRLFHKQWKLLFKKKSQNSNWKNKLRFRRIQDKIHDCKRTFKEWNRGFALWDWNYLHRIWTYSPFMNHEAHKTTFKRLENSKTGEHFTFVLDAIIFKPISRSNKLHLPAVAMNGGANFDKNHEII